MDDRWFRLGDPVRYLARLKDKPLQTNSVQERRPKWVLRALLFFLPCAWAFMLNDITSIESLRLSALGMTADATILSLIPIPLLVLWLACFQYWLTTRISALNWAMRLVALWFISCGVFWAFHQYAFRNTSTIRISQMPESGQMEEVERETGLKLSWMSKDGACTVMFDNRSQAAQNELHSALANWNPKIAR